MAKKYRNPINIPVSGHKLATCHYPLRIDTYSSCYHECLYCYGRSILSNVDAWTPMDVKVADIEEIKAHIEACLTKESPDKNPVTLAFQSRVPVRIGGQTDCLQPAERDHKVTLKLLDYLNSIDYPYLVVTKSDLLRAEEYLSRLRRDLAYVQVTITTLNEQLSKSLETRAPSPAARLAAIARLNKNGIFTAGRVSPIIPNVTEEELVSLIEELEKIGAPHIIFELFRGSPEMVEEVSAAVGRKVSPMIERGFYLRLPEEKKMELYTAVAEEMAARKPTFTFCSDGTTVPYHLHSCVNCCGWESLTAHVPETKFGCGNEKIAPIIYQKLREKGELKRSDFDNCFTFTEKAFRKCWYRGEFANYLPGCRWLKRKKKYVLESNNT